MTSATNLRTGPATQGLVLDQMVRATRSENPDALLAIAMCAAVLGAVIGAVGSFLPWAQAEFLFFSAQVSGIEGGDGWITLGGGCVAGAASLFMLSRYSRWASIVVVIAGLAIAGTATYDIANYYRMVSESALASSLTSLAYGIFVTAAGGVLTTVGGTVGLFGRSRRCSGI